MTNLTEENAEEETPVGRRPYDGAHNSSPLPDAIG
jgi:hypothetical protein